MSQTSNKWVHKLAPVCGPHFEQHSYRIPQYSLCLICSRTSVHVWGINSEWDGYSMIIVIGRKKQQSQLSLESWREMVEKVKSTVILPSMQNNLILISLSEGRSFGSLLRQIYTSKSPGSISETICKAYSKYLQKNVNPLTWFSSHKQICRWLELI